MVLLWGFLKFLLLGCLYATSRWTLTTTLFKAIKRTNLSRGSRTCFYTSSEDLVILRIKRRWVLLFLSSFSWRSNSCKKVYVLYDKDILLVIFSREFLYKFMTCRFHLLHFLLKFLLIFRSGSCGCFLYCFFLCGSLSWVFVVFSVSWLLDSILCAFS